MADKADNGNNKSRLILAPHPWPFLPESCQKCSGGNYFYLSWAGWELYLSRRLGLKSSCAVRPQPLLMADMLDPERDFLLLDQLADKASQLGAGVLNLEGGRPESLWALVEGISAYGSGRRREPAGGPLLDDRSYLALWAISEYRARESDMALVEADFRQKNMWAVLKGEEQSEAGFTGAGPAAGNDNLIPLEADSRALYAWKCWQRLAEGLISDADQIIPTICFPAE